MTEPLDADLAHAPAHRLADLVHQRALSPVELVEGFLARIDGAEPQLGAVVARDPETARTEAASAAQQAGTEGAPPLLGLPVLVKDSQATRGLRTTFATRAWSGWVPGDDDAVVARLRQAGCVVIGKTNLCELGTEPVTEPELFGPARNPWDRTRTPGGSSGGSAAALAGGLAPVVTASDGAGSIRIPAAHCHLFGLKPSRGRVSNGPRTSGGLLGLTSPGPLTRDVTDAALQLDAMCGPLAGDPCPLPRPREPFATATRGDPPRLRIGVLTDALFAPLEESRRAAVAAMGERLAGLGHAVEPMSLPVDEGMLADFTLVWAANVAGLPLQPEQLEPLNAWLARHAAAHDAGTLTAAAARLQLRARRLAEIHAELDVVCSPTVAQPPSRIGEGAQREPAEQFAWGSAQVGLTPLANLTGQPAASVPAGLDPEGLPRGVMLTAASGEEATLLALAAQLQRAWDWTALRPPP